MWLLQVDRRMVSDTALARGIRPHHQPPWPIRPPAHSLMLARRQAAGGRTVASTPLPHSAATTEADGAGAALARHGAVARQASSRGRPPAVAPPVSNRLAPLGARRRHRWAWCCKSPPPYPAVRLFAPRPGHALVSQGARRRRLPLLLSSICTTLPGCPPVRPTPGACSGRPGCQASLLASATLCYLRPCGEPPADAFRQCGSACGRRGRWQGHGCRTSGANLEERSIANTNLSWHLRAATWHKLNASSR
jgi:hypothetical protein